MTQLRSIVGTIVLIPITMGFCLTCIFTGLLGFQTASTEFIRLWARLVLRTFAIRFVVKGEEHLPDSGGGIIIFNHQSTFDIPLLMASTHKHIRFGAKAELFKIPFFGGAMLAVGNLPIARDNRAKVMKLYKKAEGQFAKGFIFVLAPEGTRQHEPIIGRFKKGPFIFAIDSGVPLIPAVIIGSHAVMSKRSLNINVGTSWSRTIYLEFLPAVSTKSRTLGEVAQITNEFQAEMTRVYYARNLSN